MAITNTSVKTGLMEGDGSNTMFPFSFRVTEESDLSVVRVDALGVETQITDFILSLNSDQASSPGGHITYPASGPVLEAGEFLLIYRNTPSTQELELPPIGGPFNPEAIEAALDRQTMVAQQLTERSYRSLRMHITAQNDIDAVVPKPIPNTVLSWDAGGKRIVNRVLSADDSILQEEISDRVADGTMLTVLDREFRGSVSKSDMRTNVADCAPIFEYAAQSRQTVLVPYGQYRFSTPALLDAGFDFRGWGGESLVNGPNYPSVPIIRPVGCAFAMRDPLSTAIRGRLDGLGFYGGTTQVDLGLLHQITLRDLEFMNFSKAGFCLVRGENHSITNMRFDFVQNAPFGLAFGYCASIHYDGSTYAGEDPEEFFGFTGAWVDRMTIRDIKLQSFDTGTWTVAGIQADAISGSDIGTITFHGNGSGQGHLIKALKYIQNSEFHNFIIDQINTEGATKKGITTPHTYNSLFHNIDMTISGNSHFTIGFDTGHCDSKVTFESCGCKGNNEDTFGFYFPDGMAQDMTLIACNGAVYSAGSTPAARSHVKLIGCDMQVSNLGAFGHQMRELYDGEVSYNFFGDRNGGACVNSAFKTYFSKGGGQRSAPFWWNKDGPVIEDGWYLRFPTKYGASAVVNVGEFSGDTPEGQITAPPGSFIFRNWNNNTGKAFVKSFGSGATGWSQIKVLGNKLKLSFVDDFLISPSQQDVRFDNNGAQKIITGVLPPLTADMEFTFIRNNSTYALRIKPSGVEGFQGATAGKYKSLDQNGGYMHIRCFSDGLAHITASNGSISTES